MKGPRKLAEEKCFLITIYRCRYCNNRYSSKKEGLECRMRCFKEHRKQVRKTYSERQKRVALERKERILSDTSIKEENSTDKTL